MRFRVGSHPSRFQFPRQGHAIGDGFGRPGRPILRRSVAIGPAPSSPAAISRFQLVGRVRHTSESRPR